MAFVVIRKRQVINDVHFLRLFATRMLSPCRMLASFRRRGERKRKESFFSPYFALRADVLPCQSNASTLIWIGLASRRNSLAIANSVRQHSNIRIRVGKQLSEIICVRRSHWPIKRRLNLRHLKCEARQTISARVSMIRSKKKENRRQSANILQT